MKTEAWMFLTPDREVNYERNGQLPIFMTEEAAIKYRDDYRDCSGVLGIVVPVSIVALKTTEASREESR